VGDRVLVLNATYEPLSVVSSRRAVVLVLDAKAEVVSEGLGAFHSAHLTVPIPSVVRLHTFVRVRRRRRAAVTRRAVLARDEHTCQYCGGRGETVDHVLPRSRGGSHSWDNVVAACRSCNAGKRDRLLGDTSMTLRCRPGQPDHMGWIALAVGGVPTEWMPYLAIAS